MLRLLFTVLLLVVATPSVAAEAQAQAGPSTFETAGVDLADMRLADGFSAALPRRHQRAPRLGGMVRYQRTGDAHKPLITWGWVGLAASPVLVFGGYFIAGYGAFVAGSGLLVGTGTVLAVAGLGAFVAGCIALPLGYVKKAKANKATARLLPTGNGLAMVGRF